jgi:hypothetical protein
LYIHITTLHDQVTSMMHVDEDQGTFDAYDDGNDGEGERETRGLGGCNDLQRSSSALWHLYLDRVVLVGLTHVGLRCSEALSVGRSTSNDQMSVLQAWYSSPPPHCNQLPNRHAKFLHHGVTRYQALVALSIDAVVGT